MIFRTVHNNVNPYFQMNRASVNDERLSYKAIGIHTYLMSKPDKWEANEADITKRHSDGKASVRAGVQELIQFGYMTRVQLRRDKKIIGWRLDTYETPELNPSHKDGEHQEYVVIDLDSENQNVDKLDSDFLDLGKQDLGNRNHSNYISEVNKEEEENVNDATKECDNKKIPSPSSEEPLPLYLQPGYQDPMLVAAQEKFNKRQASNGRYTAGWQANLNLELAADKRVPLVNAIAKVCGLTKAMTDDETAKDVHTYAVKFYKAGCKTEEMVNATRDKYLADTWRRQNHPKPSLASFFKFYSQQSEDEPQIEDPLIGGQITLNYSSV